ncbi:MAG: hypothetical protein Q9181_006297 [Wetmoreana brouardii]
MFSTTYLACTFCVLSATTALPSPGLHRRGGSSTTHTCIKDSGPNICDSRTNIPACNIAVNNLCNYISNFTVTDPNKRWNSQNNEDCHAAIAIPAGWKNYAYSDCVAGFQDIMADCIDLNGKGFRYHKEGGSKNVHFDDTLIGAAVDDKLPSWTIGAKKCYGSGPQTIVFSPTGGAAVAEP